MRASTSASSSAVTRSVLFKTITSAKATWLLASGASLSRSDSHLASATVTTASRRDLACTSSSTKKVWATGAGSARPVVSTMIASNLPRRFISPSMMRIRSPRTVQQMQPLFISNTSSSASTTSFVVDAHLAEFVDDHGVFLAVRLGENAVEQRWSFQRRDTRSAPSPEFLRGVDARLGLDVGFGHRGSDGAGGGATHRDAPGASGYNNTSCGRKAPTPSAVGARYRRNRHLDERHDIPPTEQAAANRRLLRRLHRPRAPSPASS